MLNCRIPIHSKNIKYPFPPIMKTEQGTFSMRCFSYQERIDSILFEISSLQENKIWCWVRQWRICRACSPFMILSLDNFQNIIQPHMEKSFRAKTYREEHFHVSGNCGWKRYRFSLSHHQNKNKKPLNEWNQ